MALPHQPDVEIPLLEEIEKGGGRARPSDLYAKVAAHFPTITQADLKLRHPSEVHVWSNRVQWVRQALVAKGQLDGSTRGVWALTEAGLHRLELHRSGGTMEDEAPPKSATRAPPGKALPPAELSAADLESAIVWMLEARSRPSCKREELVKNVLKHRGQTLLGNARKHFLKRLSKAAAQLRRARVLEFYRAKNERVRLAPEYASLFRDHQRRRKRRASSPRNQPSLWSDDYDGLDGLLDAGSALDEAEDQIPDLPDELDYNRNADGDGAELSRDEATDSDEDSKRLLGILTGSSEEPPAPGCVTDAEKSAPISVDLLADLERALSALPGLQVSRVFQELRLSLHVGQHVIEASVAYQPARKQLSARVTLPFVREAAMDLLLLFDRDDFTAALCLANSARGQAFCVRKAIDTPGRTAEQLSSAVQQLLSEAIQANDVLGTYG